MLRFYVAVGCIIGAATASPRRNVAAERPEVAAFAEANLRPLRWPQRRSLRAVPDGCYDIRVHKCVHKCDCDVKGTRPRARAATPPAAARRPTGTACPAARAARHPSRRGAAR